ncbi:MAG TPA: D-alanyl-D-alanine carboxypeptidase [Chitinophagaceae bacterium]|nr:D-alanyl-D-alanine carboxypeptidase [Chitinophagaceae bacterium]
MKKYILALIYIAHLFIAGCSVAKQINLLAKNSVLNDTAFISAHTGISIYEPATGKYLYNYQGDKYFVPASNTKLLTCYAAMKYLGDSLVGLRYREKNNEIMIYGAGDPTFLHPDFTQQRVFDFLKNTNKQIVLNNLSWKERIWGAGWSWDDYSDYYMPERSALPVYGNIVRISNHVGDPVAVPSFFKNDIKIDSSLNRNLFPQTVKRDFLKNHFTITEGRPDEHYTETPFHTGDSLIIQLLNDTLHKSITSTKIPSDIGNLKVMELYSRPTDSMLKPLMHHSDNFFAEQTLLMVSQKLLGVMDDEKIIDTLLKTDFKDLPQKPYWVDGSGLSHYNLFSPQDFIIILNKMKNNFGMDRIKSVMETGGTGTIKNYYKADSGFIYAKTGTLSGVVAFSGFLYTQKNKLLIFSTMVNNHNSNSTDIRRAIEKFIEEVRRRN